jgi:hypothetical protein
VRRVTGMRESFVDGLEEEETMKYLYLMTEGLSSTVIDSQVLDTLVAAEHGGVPFDLLALVPPRTWQRERSEYATRKEKALKRFSGSISVRPLPKLQSVWTRRSVALGIALRTAGQGPLLIHARNVLAGAIALGVKRVRPETKVIVDVRGDVAAEYRMRGRQGDTQAASRAEAQAELMTLCATEADRVFAVSQKLAELLVDQHGCEEERLRVFPCLADQTRFRWDPARREEMRVREGFEGKKVVVFPGSTGRWHYLDATLAFVAEWMQRDPSVFFLALSPAVDEMTQMCGGLLPAGRYRVLSAQHDEVPSWLNAADMGILLRQDDPVNRVASPTKFAEYALCGLPVAMSPGIGDYSELVLHHDSGFHVKMDTLDDSVEAAMSLLEGWKDSNRSAWADMARAHLSKAARLEDLVAEYRSLESM